MDNNLRIGIIGSGTIGSFVMDAVKSNQIKNAEITVVCGRTEMSKGKDNVLKQGIPWTTNPEDLLNYELDVIVETASHEALVANGSKYLNAGIDLIPLSLGALVDDDVLDDLIKSANNGKALLHIPSGGIGALDALQAAMVSGVDEVKMKSSKPPRAWKGISYVEEMDIDLDNVQEPVLLYEGSAKHCVKEFPQNINIAAILSLAGTGFESTRIAIWADPKVVYNTHEINFRGRAGMFSMKFENEPVPDNPKTTYMACLSAVASLKRIRNHYRIGT